MAEDANFDLGKYLNENLVKPTFEYFKELLDKIFNSNLLEEIVETIKTNTNQETEIFEDLSLKELFEKIYYEK